MERLRPPTQRRASNCARARGIWNQSIRWTAATTERIRLCRRSHLEAERKCNLTILSVGLAQRGGRNAGRDFHGSIGSRRTACSYLARPFVPNRPQVMAAVIFKAVVIFPLPLRADCWTDPR